MRTKTMLEQIVGVGSVDVMVTVESTEELVVQRNMKDTQELTEETDANGETPCYELPARRPDRHLRFFWRRDADRHQEDQTSGPRRARRSQGAENEVVKSLIVDAIQRGLNVPSYRISVVPRKQE